MDQVSLGTSDGSIAAYLDDVQWISETEIQATVPSGIEEGTYNVQVHNSNGDGNQVSSVVYEAYTPVDLSSATESVTTQKAVLIPSDGTVPVDVVLKSDDTIGRDAVSMNDISINARISQGTSITDADGNPYTGAIDAPREVAIDTDLAEKLNGGVENAVAFSLGDATQSLTVQNGTLFVSLSVTLPSEAGEPTVYYVADDGSVSLAGVDGQWKDLTISTGGTLIGDAREDVPEEGYTTWDVGVLLDHMSTYAAGTLTEKNSTGSSGCFIESAGEATTTGSGWIVIMLLGMGALLYRVAGSHLGAASLRK